MHTFLLPTPPGNLKSSLKASGWSLLVVVSWSMIFWSMVSSDYCQGMCNTVEGFISKGACIYNFRSFETKIKNKQKKHCKLAHFWKHFVLNTGLVSFFHLKAKSLTTDSFSNGHRFCTRHLPSGKKYVCGQCSSTKIPPLFTNTEVNNCCSIYQTSG